MPYEVRGALVIGLLLPLLETYRRGMAHWGVEFTSMFEDYLAGGLLLVGAWAALSHRAWARDALLVAWSWFTGLMTISLVDHIEVTLRAGSQEPDNAIVIGVKVVLWAAAAWGLISTLRSPLAAGNSKVPSL
jgi:hypothetical protein